MRDLGQSPWQPLPDRGQLRISKCCKPEPNILLWMIQNLWIAYTFFSLGIINMTLFLVASVKKLQLRPALSKYHYSWDKAWFLKKMNNWDKKWNFEDDIVLKGCASCHIFSNRIVLSVLLMPKNLPFYAIFSYTIICLD